MNAQNNSKKILLVFPVCLLLAVTKIGGQPVQYNLATMLKDGKLVTTPVQYTQPLAGPEKQAINTRGLVWLKNVPFTEGTINIDLRGKDVFLQSFLGIAFYGKDTSAYDVVYFRPFNFRHADTLRRKWSVQYMSIPNYDYAVLRKAHPQEYENAVNPVPQADEWFHATIVIRGEWITTYVNHSDKASLKVKKLSGATDGMIGL